MTQMGLIIKGYTSIGHLLSNDEMVERHENVNYYSLLTKSKTA
jgi:hypothetical protein